MPEIGIEEVGVTERQTDRDGQTDRQTDRQTETGRHGGRERLRDTEGHNLDINVFLVLVGSRKSIV